MTSEKVVWFLMAWAARTTVLFAFVGLVLWIFRVKDVSFRLSVWTVVLVGALLLPVLSLTTAQTLIPVPRVMPAPSATSVNAPSTRFPGRVPGAPMKAPSRHRDEPLAAIFVIVWAAGVSIAMLRIFVGLYFSRSARSH